MQEMQEMSSIPWLGISPGVGNGNLLQYSYLENSMDREAWWAALHGQEESDTTKLVSLHIYTHIYVYVYAYIYSKKIKTFIFCFINM